MNLEGIGTIVEQRDTGALFVEAPEGYYRVENERDVSSAVGFESQLHADARHLVCARVATAAHSVAAVMIAPNSPSAAMEGA